jgi:hypothetical protein
MNKIYRYNISSRVLDRVPINLLQPRAGCEAIKLNDNSILIIGGFSENLKALKTTEIFEVNGTSLSIRYGPPMINARREFAAVRFNNSIYVFGGENQFDKIVASIEKLDLMTDVDLEDDETSPSNFSLEQNYPNPFNPTTTISFKIPQKSKVLLEIFDIFGKRIKTLIDDELETGTYKVEWNGRDEKGNPLSSGIYIYRLSTGKVFLTKKMTLIK